MLVPTHTDIKTADINSDLFPSLDMVVKNLTLDYFFPGVTSS